MTHPTVILQHRLVRQRLCLPDFLLLLHLHAHDPAGEGRPVGDFSQLFDRTKAAMTGRADHLVKLGYLTRLHDLCDRRVVRLYLTDAGRTLLYSLVDGLDGLSLEALTS